MDESDKSDKSVPLGKVAMRELIILVCAGLKKWIELFDQ
jgi:hypothetical protein